MYNKFTFNFKKAWKGADDMQDKKRDLADTEVGEADSKILNSDIFFIH